MDRWPVFTKLVTNVKSAEEITVDLGPLTAFVSKHNRALKSALGSDAIRLALTGKHPIGPNPSDLIGLAGPEATELTATLANGEAAAKFSMPIKDGKAKRPSVSALGPLATLDDSGREQLIPTLAFRDLISLGAARSREAIFRRFGGASAAPVPPGLTDAQTKLWNAAVPASGDVADRLTAAAAHFRSEKLRLGREIKALEGTSPPAEAVAGVEQIATLRERYRDAVRLEEARRAFRPITGLAEAEAELARAAAVVAVKLGQLRETQAGVDVKKANLARLKAVLPAAKTEMERLRATAHAFEEASAPLVGLTAAVRLFVGRGLALCPCCGTSGVDLVKSLGEMERFAESTKADLAAAKKAAQDATLRVTELLSESENAEIAVGRLEREIEVQGNSATRMLGEAEARYEALKNLPQAVEPPLPPRPSTDIQAEIERLEQAGRPHESYDKARRRARELKEEQAATKALEQEAGAALVSLLQRTKISAEEAVNLYMPAGFQTSLTVDSTTCEWCVIGEDGRPHGRGAMSGAEEATLVIALALAWPPAGGPRYVVLDDRDLGLFSKETLEAVLTRLEGLQKDDAVTQVFVCWTRPEEIPASWTIIDTTALGQAALGAAR